MSVIAHPSASVQRQRRRLRMALALETVSAAMTRRPDAEWEAFQALVADIEQMFGEEMAREGTP